MTYPLDGMVQGLARLLMERDRDHPMWPEDTDKYEERVAGLAAELDGAINDRWQEWRGTQLAHWKIAQVSVCCGAPEFKAAP